MLGEPIKFFSTAGKAKWKRLSNYEEPLFSLAIKMIENGIDLRLDADKMLEIHVWLRIGAIGAMLMADLRHYLGQDLSIIELPAPAARLRDYLGSIVAAVTLRNDWETDKETPISCRKRPGHKRCEGNIIALFDEGEPSAIKWLCPFCGDGGYIRGWEGTFWDKTTSR